MDELDEIDRSTWELLQEVKESRIYQTYLEQERRISADPELMERIRRFRGANFHTQQGSGSCDMEWFEAETKAITAIPQVNSYLEAELALCRLMQRICRTLTDGIEFNAPDI